MKCPNKSCRNKKNFQELRRSSNDNIDKLSHSYMICQECGRHFNHWNEPTEKIKTLLGELYL